MSDGDVLREWMRIWSSMSDTNEVCLSASFLSFVQTLILGLVQLFMAGRILSVTGVHAKQRMEKR